MHSMPHDSSEQLQAAFAAETQIIAQIGEACDGGAPWVEDPTERTRRTELLARLTKQLAEAQAVSQRLLAPWQQGGELPHDLAAANLAKRQALEAALGKLESSRSAARAARERTFELLTETNQLQHVLGAYSR